MTDASSSWDSLCELVAQLRCWVRVVTRAQGNVLEGRWGQLLTIPIEGYLESSGGPVPLADVAFVEISTKRIKGGLAGRPKQLIDIEEELVSVLRDTLLTWELRESSWAVEGVFDEEPVRVVRVQNPFGPAR